MKLPQGVTWVGLLITIAVWVGDPQNAPMLTGVIGDHAAVKIIAAATVLAGLGRSVLGSTRKLPKGFTALGMVITLATLVADTMYGPALATLFGEHTATAIASAGALLASVGAAIGGATHPKSDGPEGP